MNAPPLDFWGVASIVFSSMLMIVSFVMVFIFFEIWRRRRKFQVTTPWPFRNTWSSSSSPAWLAGFILFCGMTHAADLVTLFWWNPVIVQASVKFLAVLCGFIAVEMLWRQLPQLAELPRNVDQLVKQSLSLKVAAGLIETKSRISL